MPNVVPLGVTGTDGIVPIYDPNRSWHMWSRDEIFVGADGANMYVPKVNDYVIEPETYTMFIVEFIDPVTLLPTLREIRPGNMSFSLSQTDVLFGVGPGTQSDTYRAYIDDSVEPAVMAVDSRLKIAGSLSSYAKIFKGANVSATGIVISRVYDNNNNFISDNVPLELVALENEANYSIKTISVCNTNETLLDGDLVTAVIYNDQGHVVSKRQLLIENTSFIRDINTSIKYITNISLETAFMSPTLDNTIDFPLNIPLNALNIIGVVNYSDGSVLRLPVDNSKFSIFGLEQYVSSIIGQSVDLVLSYSLGSNETAVGAVSGDGKYITENYRLVTVNPNNSYAVKLFVYPRWVSPAIGYELRWFLYNLDRNIYFDVTQHVTFSAETGPYNPKAYGFLQRKSVSVDLADVTGMFEHFIHIQSVDIVLNHEPDTSITNTPWEISHESSASRPLYGDGLYAFKVNATDINIASGITVMTEWLDRVYYRTYPLIDAITEQSAIAPSHFILSVHGLDFEFPIAQWNDNLTTNIDINEFEDVLIRFIKRTGSNDLQLAISSMIVKV